MTTDTVIELQDVMKNYRGRLALDGCSLSIPRGRVAAVVGSNGAGKSTLLKIVAGITSPTSGAVTVLDGPAEQDSEAHLARLGYLDQERPLYRSFRVRDMLTAAARTNDHWNDTVARQYLERLGIGLDQRIRDLSGGQQAQVALTLCLAKEPEVLILDEPAAALDPAARQDLLQLLMHNVSDSDLTVVLSTHALDDVVAVCDYLVVVARGRVVLADDLDFILQSHRIVRGSPSEDQWPAGAVAIEVRRTAGDSLALLRLELPVTNTDLVFEEPTLDEIILAYMRANQPGVVK